MEGNGASVEALRARIAALEEELHARKRSNARLEAVLEAVPSIVMHLDRELRLLDISRPVDGYTADAVRGTDFLSHVPEGERPKVERILRAVLSTGAPTSFATIGPGPSGTLSRYESYVAPMRIDGTPVELVVVATDVTAHHAREGELRARDLQLAVASEVTGLGLWTWDLTTKKVTWNEGMRTITGIDEPLAMDEYIERVVHPDDQEMLTTGGVAMMAGTTFQSPHHRIVRPDGEIRWVVAQGRVERNDAHEAISVVGSTLDVTAHREAEAKRTHSERLAAVGTLAAGVSHNFNNHLATIIPALEMLRSDVAGRNRDVLDDALHAARRSTDLVRQLLAFSRRRDTRTLKPELFEPVIERAVDMGKRLLDPRIELRFQSSTPNVYVRCDASAIEQAVINLFVNARDAIVDRGRPRGRIDVTLDVDGSKTPAEVVLRVEDDGTGMDESVRSRIFEPFFTTKDAGQGTGLGLSVTYATVEAHGATIRCESAIGIGTTFEIRLPRIAAPASRPSTEVSGVHPPRRAIRILLCDDDDGIRQVIGMWLEHMGHTAQVVSTLDEAAETLAREPRFDVALLDRSLAAPSPEAVIDRLRTASPKSYVVYFSGDDVPETELPLVDYVLPKPTSEGALDAMLDALFGDVDDEANRVNLG